MLHFPVYLAKHLQLKLPSGTRLICCWQLNFGWPRNLPAYTGTAVPSHI